VEGVYRGTSGQLARAKQTSGCVRGPHARLYLHQCLGGDGCVVNVVQIDQGICTKLGSYTYKSLPLPHDLAIDLPLDFAASLPHRARRP
jgi:hypothetical protein